MATIDLSKLITAEMKATQARAAQTAAIEVERNRRLSIGFAYDFGDARGVHRIGTSEQDMRGGDEVTKVANAMLALGDQTSTIDIVTETGSAVVTAIEWQCVLVAAGMFRQPIWAASFALQAKETIPADVTVDALWP
ncbi:MAG: hypothetical protein ACTHNN_16535 [Xanthobacteraceae bacterium]